MEIEEAAGEAGGVESGAEFHRRRRRRERLLGLILLGCLLASFGRAAHSAQAPPRDEYQVKAAFLFNFAKFVEWPTEAFPDGAAPLIIGVLGSDPFGATLDQTISGKSINNRQLVLRRLKAGQSPKGCHILFICSSEGRRMAQILDGLRGASVLTVGEMDRFAQQGGIIGFLTEENKVRFEINAAVAEHARLKISSKLLALAKTVRGR